MTSTEGRNDRMLEEYNVQSISSDIRSYIVKQYLLGSGTLELAQELNIHRSTVQRVLNQACIPLRKRTPYSKYDVQFFDAYTAESCYWAGFLMADGCSLTKRATISVHLARKDRDHLERLMNCIKFTGRIEDCKDGSCRLSINGSWYPVSLQTHFSLYPRKTLTCEYPPNLPPEMDRHFIRGLLDGDGSVCFTSAPSVSFIGSKKIMNALSRKFSQTLFLKLKSGNEYAPVCDTLNPSIGTLSYSGKNAKRILDWLYEDAPADCWMPRKREAYNFLFFDFV